ncbi:FAD-binding oxidoreductase [Bradyrhizobium japonicum]|uniref:FAD-binding oxidoreductase n=1 Tax=Bradyrhizobium japonicum TaxID=375 RepID=UPI0004AF72E2|nr:FAD-binding oxidoreductase [Bradyrhizobium japonicum]
MTRYVATDDLQSWGRVVRTSHRVARPRWRDEILALIAEGTSDEGRLLAVGLGRSYGDTCLNANGSVIDATGLDRIISFASASRLLRAEAGISIDAVLKMIVSRGLFLPVTPGTRFVTLGGAVANDVHGKNHHSSGTFGRWIRRLCLRRSDGQELELGPNDKTGLFAATIGGLGLTGMMTWVEIELSPIDSAMIESEIIPFSHIAEFFQIAAESENQFEYTVAWVDCCAKGASLGRGLFIRGRHAKKGSRLAQNNRAMPVIPFDIPSFVLSDASIRAFNAFYYWSGRRKAGRTTLPYWPFFYPLDAVGRWNRMYGSTGMYQYQAAVPPDAAENTIRAMLGVISAAGKGSFLAVLKTFGEKPSPGLLSFPMPGATLALDFPNHGASTLAIMTKLDAIVREAGGRLYPAKDGRISADMFRSGYPNLQAFTRHVDLGFSSSFWRRVSA